MNGLPFLSPDPYRSPRSWVVWGSGLDSETVRLHNVAQALGKPASVLLAWLENVAPPEGGRAGGRWLRWATGDEVAAARQTPAPWMNATGTRVHWTYPDGRTEVINLSEAAGRLVNADGKPITLSVLKAVLAEVGAWCHMGHVARLVDPSAPKPRRRAPQPDHGRDEDEDVTDEQQQQAPAAETPASPQQAIAPAEAEDAAAADPPAPPAPPAAETPAAPGPAPAKRPGNRLRAVRVNGQHYESIQDAAAVLGLSSKALSHRLNRNGGRVFVSGSVVESAAAEPRKRRPVRVGDAVVPSVTDAARQLGASWADVKKAIETGQQLSGLSLSYYTDQAPPAGPAAAEDGDRPDPAPSVPQWAQQAAPEQPAVAEQQQQILSADVLKLVASLAQERGATADDLVLSALPVDGALAQVLEAVDRQVLRQLGDNDWVRLRAIARVG